MLASLTPSDRKRAACNRQSAFCDAPQASPRPSVRNDVLLLAIEGLDSENVALAELILDDHRMHFAFREPPAAFLWSKNDEL